MQKKVIAVAVAGIFASSIVGAHFYSDHRLNEYYAQNQAEANSLIQKESTQINMGLFSGDARWTYKISPNPCKPQDVIELQGVDHIQRSWNGYHIKSEVNLVLKGEDAKKYQDLFQNKALLTLDSRLNWFGSIDMKVHSPSLSKTKDNFQAVWNGIEGTIKLKKKQQKYEVTKFELQMPGFTVRDGNNYFSLQGMQLKSDQALLGQMLRSGKSEFSIQKMIILDQSSRLKKNIEMQKLQLSTSADVQVKETNVKSSWSIEQIQVDDKKLNNLKLNFNVSGLDTAALQAFMQVMNTTKKTCSVETQQAQQKQLTEQMLKVISHGFSFESKGNQIELGQSKMTADLQGKFSANQYSDIQDFRLKAPQSAQFEAHTQVDKQFLRNVLNMTGKMPSGVSEQDYDRALTQMAQAMHGKVNGDNIDFAIKYENGQTTYP
ncbi:DUF945 family protein [Acinetobacter sp. MB5]|uniref:DUF945 family protein n=1 Tax=Acinetobacter sp. MB5 TaxID=2069438 RepID=UPI000DD0A7CD|nr:DUF945 family protein [Acinetobacter sp. MB5]